MQEGVLKCGTSVKTGGAGKVAVADNLVKVVFLLTKRREFGCVG